MAVMWGVVSGVWAAETSDCLFSGKYENAAFSAAFAGMALLFAIIHARRS